MNIDLHITLGNQLFSPSYLDDIKPKEIYMCEDIGLCTFQKHHKQKIILYLSAMRSYKDELSDKYKVKYRYINKDKSDSYIDKLIEYIRHKKIKHVSIFEIEDEWFRKEINKIKNYIDVLHVIKTPMFLTTTKEFNEMVDVKKATKKALPKYKMTDFYIKQRKRLNILITDKNKPVGDKWTYDMLNRKRIPKDLTPPPTINFKRTENTNEVIKIVDVLFSDHYGSTNDFNYPTTRKDALKNLKTFIKTKLSLFGDYEDSVDQRSPYWFHSNISTSLNIGLITPYDILLEINNINDIPINSLEGFIRQIIGWREFMRGLYNVEGKSMKKSNFFNNNRKLKQSWYEGTTGLEPLDYSIKSTLKYSYSHHIERLMIQVNLMNLCEIEPTNAYKWFMELYIDSSDWVMTPNVYSMGMFADGGIMATKPYICGSNYILKMMDFKKGEWCQIMDGLYWRFIKKNRNYLKKNPRSSMMVNLFDKMNDTRKKDILNKANIFIDQHTI